MATIVGNSAVGAGAPLGEVSAMAAAGKKVMVAMNVPGGYSDVRANNDALDLNLSKFTFSANGVTIKP